jgi:hypothetical protein
MSKPMFTLAPSDHPTDPKVLEGGYKLWSTFQRRGASIYVRTNNNRAGGQMWERIARKAPLVVTSKTGEKRTKIPGWRISAGKGYLAQASKLLARYLIQEGNVVRCETEAYAGKVVRYRATSKVYSLPSILNGYQAVVNRDRQADERRKHAKRELADLVNEMLAKRAAKEAAK